jgi:hypothetical protein
MRDSSLARHLRLPNRAGRIPKVLPEAAHVAIPVIDHLRRTRRLCRMALCRGWALLAGRERAAIHLLAVADQQASAVLARSAWTECVCAVLVPQLGQGATSVEGR